MMRIAARCAVLALGFQLFLPGLSASGALQVVNGGFESGKTGWEFSANGANWTLDAAAGTAKAGSISLVGSESDAVHSMYPAGIAQTLAGGLVAGRYHQLGFWLKTGYTGTTGHPPYPIHQGRLLVDGQAVASTRPVAESAYYSNVWNYYRLTYRAAAADAGKSLRFELSLDANGAVNFSHRLDEIGIAESDTTTTFGNLAITPVSRLGEAWWSQRQTAVNNATSQGGAELLFIGDSITQGWESASTVWNQYYGARHPLNLGFSGDQTQHVLWRLDHGNLGALSPKVAVLLIGVNNIGGGSMNPQDTFTGIEAVVNLLRARLPKTRILLLAIFPSGYYPDDRWRQRCMLVNSLLPRLADGTRVHFLDIGSTFLEPNGTISTQVMSDYLHPTVKGYQIWAQAMEPKLAELLSLPDPDLVPVKLSAFDAQ